MTVTHADAVNEPILRHKGTGTTLPTTGDNALYHHRNQQYSIIGLTNAAGTLVERYSYTAYGTLGIYDASGTVRTSSTYANRYTYTGREYDSDLNLYHFRARWYDPTTGGFISRDPLGYVDGMSLYRGYFGVYGVDPFGMLTTAQEKTVQEQEPPKSTRGMLPTDFPGTSEDGCSAAACIRNCATKSETVIIRRKGVVITIHPRQSCIDQCKGVSKAFLGWYTEQKDTSWADNLPACPCSIVCTRTHRCFDRRTRKDKTWTTESICNPDPDVWGDPASAWNPFSGTFFYSELYGGYHYPGHYEIRTKHGKHGNQCIYDSAGILITEIPTAGSADKVSPNSKEGSHMAEDVYPFDWAKELGPECVKAYFEVRPANGGKPCKQYNLSL
ncbi:MAG: RHS repeat-associated core domain-containing protein [Planctomycetaceae bacterium]|nr:RHS repeat-associated core domain-containing protein [Planctomycetaceae bacterium]